MSEADELQKQLYMNKKYQLYNQEYELIGGYSSLRELKESMYELYCDFNKEAMQRECDVWFMIKPMNTSSFSSWLEDAFCYSFK